MYLLNLGKKFFIFSILMSFISYPIWANKALEIAILNDQNNNGFIPGIRPGPPTKEYLMRVIIRITWGGALFLGTIAVIPSIASFITGLESTTSIVQSTSLLIMVGVALDTMRQLESQLLMRNYDGFVN